MDGSLASIFMNQASAQRPPCGGDTEWSALDIRSPEELQYNLMCASMELRRAKAAAKEEEKIQEAKLHHLQELLATVRKERDEARNECTKLRERLSQQSSSTADSPCSFLHASPMASSPSSAPWSLQELEEHLNSDSFCDFAKVPAPLELQQTLQTFSESCNGEHGFQALFLIEPTCGSIPEHSESPFSLEVLEQGSPFDADPSLNLADLEHSHEAMQGVSESTQSTRSLSRQSSANSSSASVQMLQQGQTERDVTNAITPSLSSVKVEGLEVSSADAYMPSLMVKNVSLSAASSASSPVLLPTGNVPITSSPAIPLSKPTVCAEGLPGMKVTPLNMQVLSSVSPSNVSPVPLQAKTNPFRQVHLPVPPEADPQVMLSSLPEKGKLLQAVMQAGPLLQTLLLAGPLPQWRHPPPALSTGDIPKVSMVPSSNLILPYPYASVGSGHIKYLTTPNNGAASSVTKARSANADTCARPKKLRKLSPAPHQSQLMHMWSGDGRMPVAVVSYPPTIY